MDIALPVILFVLGFAAGGGAIWFLISRRVTEAREHERNIALADIRVAEERAATANKNLDELRAGISGKGQLVRQRDEEIVHLKEQIAVLQTRLSNEEKKTKDSLQLLDDAEEKFVAKLSQPVTETLAKLNAEITVVKDKTTNVGEVASKLVKALQKPEVRGQWGEMALERVFEVCGLSEGRDYFKQKSIGEDDAKQRPDYIVRMPGDKHLAIDAKAPISAYLEAAEEANPGTKQEKLERFVGHVRERVRQLSSKCYHRNLADSPEFVVLYLPTEAVISAALSLDVELLEYAAGQRVLLAGPTITMSLVLAVAHGWKQETVERHAKDIYELGKELYKRLATFDGHIGNLRSHLDGSVKAYNRMVGSLEQKVMPQARKFEQYGAKPIDVQLDELNTIDTVPRTLRCPDFQLVESDGDAEDQESLARPR